MRPPESPPLLSDLANKLVETDRLFHAIYEIQGCTVDDKYLHWDELRHRKPPGDLSSHEWWAALKTRRNLLYRRVPLKDRRDEPFVFLLADPVPERLHEIDLGAGGLIQMPEQIVNPDTRDRYYISSLIEEAITSSQLEGAATTRKVAREMLRAGRPPRDSSERMILNNYQTMNRIGKLKNEPLTRDLVFEIHRRITEQTLDEVTAAGRLRRSDEQVVVEDIYGEVFHEPPPAEQLESRLKAMCDFANGKTPDGFIHPVIRSIILHFWLAYDHPFVDGNGRTARALFYWSMLKHGFWLFEFISISQIILKAPAKYGRAFLYTETDDNDLTYFILYHLEVIRRAIEQLHSWIGRKAEQVRQAERELGGILTLNHRQRALVSHALRHPHHRYTIASHRFSHNVVYETARTDLLDLVERGLLEMTKVGRTMYFTPAKDIHDQLAGTS